MTDERWTRARLALALVGLLSAACGGSGQPGTWMRVGTCERDPAQIAEQRACVGDDDCPCGAHCSLGQCLAQCMADSDCGSDEVCDDFGRCRGRDAVSLVPAGPREGSERPVRVEERTLPIDPSTGEGRIHVTVEPGLPALRVEATPGLRLVCPGDGAEATSCLIESPAADGGSLTIVVRLADDGDGTPLVVTVHGGDHFDSVTVVPDDDAPDPKPLAGVYEGMVHLVRLGFSDGSTPPAESSPVTVEVPVQAEVFGETAPYTVRIRETLPLLSATGELIGSLQDGDPLSASFPRTLLFDAGDRPHLPTDVWADVTAREVRHDPTAGTLTFLLEERVGLTPEANRPTLLWSIGLTRRDGPSGDATPEVPADYEPAFGLERGQTPSAWEAAYRALFDRPVPVGAEALELYRRDLPGVPEQAALDLHACTGDLDALSAAATEMLRNIAVARMTITVRDGTGTVSGSIAPFLADFATAAEALAYRTGDGSNWSGSIDLNVATNPAYVALEGAGDIACAWAGVVIDVNFPDCGSGGGVARLALPDVDRCEEVARAYDCEIVTRTPASDDPPAFVVTGTAQQDGCGLPDPAPVAAVRGLATRACRLRLPRTPAACAEGALCAGPEMPATDAAMLTDDYDAARGDALCEAGPRGLATPAMANAALDPTDPARRTTADVFSACLTDLARLDDAPPTVTPASGDVTMVFDASAACFAAARWLAALGFASQDLRDLAHGTTVRPGPAAELLTHRLVQQWLSAHAFVASEGAQRERLGDIVRAEGGSPPAARDVLERAARAWEPLLHPRFFSALARLSGRTLAAPDYRAAFFGRDGEVTDVQAEGLPVTLGRTLLAQLRLLDVILERAERYQDTDVAGDTSALLRRALPLLALRSELSRRAREDDPNPGWAVLETQLDTRLAGLVPLVIARSQRVREGQLPISETDVPLYFLGDEVGPGGRFSAVSDFLLGTDPGDPAWAPTLTAKAAEAFEAARTAYDEQQARLFARRLSAARQQARVENIEREYEDILTDYCGSAPGGSWLDLEDFSAGRCFRSPEPSCQLDGEAYLLGLADDDVGYQLCMGAEMADLLGPGAGFRDPRLQAAAEDPGCSPTIEACDEGDACLRCGARSVPLQAGSLQLPVGSATAEALTTAHQRCRARLPMARQSLPPLPTPSASCLSGSLGEAWLAAEAAALDVEIARSELQESVRAYDIAMRGCNRIVRDNTTRQNLRNAHLTTMSTLGAVKLAADITANVAASVKDCAATIAGTEGAKGVAAGISCGGAVVEGIARSVSDAMAFSMEEATRRYEADLEMLQEEQDAFLCTNDARQELVGIDTATLRIRRAIFDQIAATVALQNAIALADGQWAEGRERRERARSSAFLPPEDTRYLDERIVTFERRMALARRAIALAVRAVEYEHQLSSEGLGMALRARTPDELEAVLYNLWSASGTRTVAGNRPSDLKVVLSLRDQILRLADRSGLPRGEQELDPTERFRLLLTSPRFAVYGPDGAYLGQRIPFHIAPADRVPGGDGITVPLLTGSDCAERLWSVNASILGDEKQLYAGSSTTFVRMDLLKSNSFYSQWCDPSGRSAPVQAASVRPNRNLFRIPGVGAEVGNAAEQLSDSFTRARMEAFLNVDRATFEADDYANGDTSELAARGLYGDYALFIPASVLSVASEDGSQSEGLVLDAVDDILLRLDYVSVAKP